jgi:hypothetical protein
VLCIFCGGGEFVVFLVCAECREEYGYIAL